jgi:hypothetical protein
MFTKGFGDGGGYVCAGDTIGTEEGPFTVTARIVHDESAHIYDDDMHHEDPTSATFDGAPAGEYERTQEARAAWFRDEWFYCGIVLSVDVDGIVLDDHAASLWGIEANYPPRDPKAPYDNSYLTEVANDLLPEAIDAARERLARLVGAANRDAWRGPPAGAA